MRVSDLTLKQAALRNTVLEHKVALLYGAEGAGKTHLLRSLSAHDPHWLYCSRTRHAREVLVALLGCAEQATAASAANSMQSATLIALKGRLQSKLARGPYVLMLDGIEHPSTGLVRMIKDLHYLGRTPLLLSARSPHMEDIGGLRVLCPDGKQRMKLRAWPTSDALQLARSHACPFLLDMEDCEEFLRAIVRHSSGLPGPTLALLQMASLPQYHNGNSIKKTLLFTDYAITRGLSS